METLFQNILDDYRDGSIRVDSSTDIYQDLVRKLPKEIREFLNRGDLLVKGAMGQGNKSSYPWVTILNKNITTSTQNGLYIAYLFRRDMSGFYLVLQQGITYFEKIYRKNKYKAAETVAKYFRDEIDSEVFEKAVIDLKTKRGDLGYGYEKTTILSKFYENRKFTERKLKSDLSKMLDVYDLVVKHFKSRSYDEVIKSVIEYERFINDENSLLVDGDKAELEIKETLDPDGELPFGFNRSLVEVKPEVDKTNKFKRITDPIIKKINYVKKAKKDAETGLLGEQLIIDYEKYRLQSIGLDDYVDKVLWVSTKSDYFGYDIKSFDIIDGVVQEIQIEVKSSTSKVDVEFQVSKGEVERSKQNSNTYFVYRVYDIANQYPKFYRVRGAIEDNFSLDPITFLAKYKGNEIRQ